MKNSCLTDDSYLVAKETDIYAGYSVFVSESQSKMTHFRHYREETSYFDKDVEWREENMKAMIVWKPKS